MDPSKLFAVLSSERQNYFYVRLKFSNQLNWRFLTDTGSCANALLESFFNELNLTNLKPLIAEKPFPYSVRMDSGERLPIWKQAEVSSQIGLHYFQDSFLLLPTMKSGNRKNPIFRKHNFTIDPT